MGNLKCLAAAVGVVLMAGLEANAQAVIDGSAAGDESVYGPALSVQNTNTQFGNATNGDPRIAMFGSEINQVFGAITGGRLNVLITGNLENNFNKLEVFVDSEPGGQNQIDGANSPAFVDPFCCSGSATGALQNLDGFRFDNGFAADHYFTFSNGDHTIGNIPNGVWTLTAYYGDLTDGLGGASSDIGFQYRPFGFEPGLAQGEPIDQLNNGCSGPTDTNCNPPEHEFAEPDSPLDPNPRGDHRDLLNDIGFLMAIDNSNAQGVNAGTGPSTGNPQDVLTGLEFSVPLEVIGSPTNDIRITAFINNGPHTFVSNQFSGVGVLQGNLGGNISGINLANIAGTQFVTVPAASADLDIDGDVDIADLVAWQRNDGLAFGLQLWQAQQGALAAVSAVPEPSAGLLALAALAMLGRRRA
ncbi:MAG: hypothetical protein AAGA92_15975 [Planctomycetota bacterium]